MSSEVWVARRKWPDGPHYEVLATQLGEDEHGTWFGAPLGTPVILPDRTERTGEYNVVTCLPRDDWYLASFWHDHPEVDIYVDICSPPRWMDGRVEVIDLDFDVVVWKPAMQRAPQLVDEDEFDEHRITLGYPDDLQANARRAAAEVFAHVQRGDAPFNLACAEPWLDALLA